MSEVTLNTRAEASSAEPVAWLRDQVEYGDPFGIHEDLADAIEAGEWK